MINIRKIKFRFLAHIMRKEGMENSILAEEIEEKRNRKQSIT